MIDDRLVVLFRLLDQHYAFPIRGGPLDTANLNHTRRRLHSRGGEPATFAAEPHHWFALDIDHVPAPPLTDLLLDPEALVEHLIGQLPRELHDATVFWELTSSAGLPKDDPNAPDLISMRFFLLSEEPLDDASLKRWAAAANAAAGYQLIDDCLFNAIQAHYTAKPRFERMADPLPQRAGIRRGLVDTVSLIIPPPDKRHPERIGTGGYAPGIGVEAFLAGKPRFREHIRSAIASFIATWGAKADCTKLKQRIREVIDDADKRGRDDDYIDRLKSDQHLDEMIEAIRAFQGDTPGRGFMPEPPPYLDLPPPHLGPSEPPTVFPATGANNGR